MRCIHGHGFVGVPHSGAEEFRRTARENMLQGADLLKTFATPGMPPINGSFIPHFLTREEIRTVVEEAAGKNLPVVSHCIGGQGLVDCVEEGVDVIEHAYCIDDAGLELVTKYGCRLDLTSGILLDPSGEEFLSPASVDCCRRMRDAAFSCMEKVMKSGVKFALGTDAYHGLLYREVKYAVQCGASSLNTMKDVTVNAAKNASCRRIKATIGGLLYANKKGAAGMFPAAPNCVIKNSVFICFTQKSISMKRLIRSCKHGQLPFR
ncbi:amidohydrolase family protein [Oscillibacter sp.]|uniref:amidohydrolase family protein n=1 Tax=Oscillibacter sp. TaxID=1945593 RepID=UPI0037CCA567